MSVNPEEHVVMREVNSSIILYDAVAVMIWIGALISNKQWRALKLSFIGFLVYYVVDAIIWMSFMKVRVIESTNHINPYLIQIWLQLGPGVIHPSWVVLMFEGTFGPKKGETRREFWVLLFLLVQFTPAFMQQNLTFGGQIVIARNMQSQRWLFILIGLLGYLYLVYRRVSVKCLWQLFLICTSVETCFEVSLLVSDIRKATLQTIIIDSVIEFNVGAAIILEVWRKLMSKGERDGVDLGPEAYK